VLFLQQPRITDNKPHAVLEFSNLRKYDYASFFQPHTHTRSLLPWAAVDPDRRLNNP